MTASTTPLRRYFTPLRYPGGKSKLSPYIKRVLLANSLTDGLYVEPYAGGAGIALELLFQGFVTSIHINDLNRPIYSFWASVLQETESLVRLIRDTPVSVEAWDRQKAIYSNPDKHSLLHLGFATFFLNRTNRSGILNGGIIGGRGQQGRWTIEARYNAAELVRRVEAVARIGDCITLTNLDALDLLATHKSVWGPKTLIYLDPPYFIKGRDLYYDFYSYEDHRLVSDFMSTEMSNRYWVVSYDDAKEIRELYAHHRSIEYLIGYTARSARVGQEVMFFSKNLSIPSMK